MSILSDLSLEDSHYLKLGIKHAVGLNSRPPSLSNQSICTVLLVQKWLHTFEISSQAVIRAERHIFRILWGGLFSHLSNARHRGRPGKASRADHLRVAADSKTRDPRCWVGLAGEEGAEPRGVLVLSYLYLSVL